MSEQFAHHKDLLERAITQIASRDYWSPYPEQPSGKFYGETAKDEQTAQYEAMLGKPFAIDQPGTSRHIGSERSPYGRELQITYPSAPLGDLIKAAKAAQQSWQAVPFEDRALICLEIVHRLNRASYLMAHAVSATTGQSFVMAFQAGGPHAQDRALEAIAYGVAEMRRVPASSRWEKPQGRGEPIRLDKAFRIVPRGIAVVIGCATFPTWNGYPGLFASLVTGNPVIVKPHPNAILPLAVTVRIAREVLAQAGLDPNTVLLAPDTADAPIAKELVQHPDVAIVDFTGSSAFGGWIRANAAGKLVYTEEAGVNAIVIAGAPGFKAMCDNIAFSLSLYSGQMCTAPQNIFVPKGGIETDEGAKSHDEVAQGIAAAVDRLLGDNVRAMTVLGAIQSEATLTRIDSARKLGRVVRDSAPVPGQGQARTATPLIVAVEAADEAAYMEERFGPIAFVIACRDADDAIAHAAASIRRRGGLTAALYARPGFDTAAAESAFAAAGVPLSVNLSGGIFVNQSAAFSDYHGTGANPAANACLTDSAYVANRFRVATVRRLVA